MCGFAETCLCFAKRVKEPEKVGLGEIRLPLNWRFGPASRDIGDATYATRSHTFIGAGLRPLAPVHVRGKRAVNDLTLTWVRRTRIGGDSWEASEVALAEDSESYEVDIMAGAVVKRTIAASAPSAAYTAAQQIADFGSVQPAVSVKVHQLGAVYGRGTAAAAVV